LIALATFALAALVLLGLREMSVGKKRRRKDEPTPDRLLMSEPQVTNGQKKQFIVPNDQASAESFEYLKAHSMAGQWRVSQPGPGSAQSGVRQTVTTDNEICPKPEVL